MDIQVPEVAEKNHPHPWATSSNIDAFLSELTKNLGMNVGFLIPYFKMEHFRNPCDGNNFICLSYLYNHLALKRQISLRNLSKKEITLIPVNLNEAHWVLAIVDIKSRCFVYIDSNEKTPSSKNPIATELKEKLEKFGIGKHLKAMDIKYSKQDDCWSCGYRVMIVLY